MNHFVWKLVLASAVGRLGKSQVDVCTDAYLGTLDLRLVMPLVRTNYVYMVANDNGSWLMMVDDQGRSSVMIISIQVTPK